MSEKVRVYEVAEEASIKSAEVIKKAKDLGIELKSANSTVTIDEAEELLNYIMTGKSKLLKSSKEETPKKTQKKQEKKSATKKKEEKPKKTQKSKKEEKKEEEKEEKKVKTTKEKIFNKKEEKEEVKEAKKEEVKEKKEEKEAEPEFRKPVLPKRRGLKIVKKKKEVKEEKKETEEEKKKIPTKSLSEIFDSYEKPKDEKEQEKKKKTTQKQKKKTAQKQDHGNKLELEFTTDEEKENEDIFEKDEVVLLDISTTEQEEKIEEPELKLNVKSPILNNFKNPYQQQRPQGLRRSSKKKKTKQQKEKKEIKSVVIPEDIRVYEFAEKIGKTTGEIISVLFNLGMMVTKNDFLDNDAIEIIADEFGIEVTIKDTLEEIDYINKYQEVTNEKNLKPRPPVITIMGHVDHGKTSLLDKIRNDNVAASEAGGITQHIGAYTIEKNGQKITFIDTPGHEAFSQMRARGANATDIIIIVVAADDGVKPQTKEAIAHAKASNAPIIVAVNKIDKPTANIELVKTQMAENGMLAVDWGGDIEFIPVSAHTGEGIDELLETILIQAEILELKADFSAKAKAVIIESALEKGRGAVATVILQNGTLKISEPIVADTTFGRVKAIINDKGQKIKELFPGEAGQILGLNEVPSAGTILVSTDSEKEAREIATKRAEHFRQKELSKSTKVSLDELSNLIAEGKIKTLPVIIKADVVGSLEAIKGSLEKIKNDEVKVNIIHSGVGGITESDLNLASASENCIILGFNVRPTGSVKQKAKAEGIEIHTYRVIYDLIEDVKNILAGMMSPVIKEENTGQAEVRETFNIPKVGTVAGCIVNDGKVIKGGLARVIRDGVVIYTGTISSLKRFKDDVKEVANGYECGIMIDGYNDVKVGDVIETFIELKEKAKID